MNRNVCWEHSRKVFGIRTVLSLHSLFFVVLVSVLAGSASAASFFGLVSKSLDDVNFIDAARGCQDAAQANGDVCVHIGAKGPANPRLQAAAFSQAEQSGRYAGFALSVVLSEVMAAAVEDMTHRVPVITFDSPFTSGDSHLSPSFVGIDNVQFGRELARLAQNSKPQGGTVFLMGDMHDPNLHQRIMGVRQQLSGDVQFPGLKRLEGEGGWSEPKRSPWFSGDNPRRVAEELRYTFFYVQPDVFISVGHWPIVDVNVFRKSIQIFQGNSSLRTPHIFVGVGRVLDEYKPLLDDGSVDGLISIDFYAMGKQAYFVMKELQKGHEVDPVYSVPTQVVVKVN